MSENEAHEECNASLRLLTREKDYARLEPVIQATESDSFLVGWIDDNGFSLVHWCAMGGLPSALIRLLEAGANPNARGPNNQTPLMWAAMTQQLLCMQILADYGANLLLRDELGDNALNIACQQESIYSIMWLLNRHSPIHECNVVGTSAAHWASFSGSYMTLSLLDAYGFDMLSVYDRKGCLPLHKLLELEFWGTARMLVTLNPQLLLAKTEDGKSLQDFAVDRCLPAKTFDEWWKLCQNRLHKTDGPKASASGDADDSGNEGGGGMLRAFSKVRHRIWLAFIDLVDKLEANNSTKGFIPLIAYAFGLTFALAHYAVLWRYNEALIELLSRVKFLRHGATLLLRVAPWMGLLAIIVFTGLLIARPGYASPNYFGRIILPNTPAKEAKTANVEVELSEEDDIKFWGPLKKLSTYLTTLSNASEHTCVSLADERAAAEASNKLRFRRRQMFESVLQTVNSLEAQVLLSAGMVATDVKSLESYLHTKGCTLKFNRSANGQLRPQLPYFMDRMLRDRLNLRRVCPTCWIRREMRTKHCSVCDRCCHLMDHHCVWINNCVGKENHLMFAVFVFAASLSQWHQVLLLLCSPLLAARRSGSVGVTGWLLVIVASGLHFVTSRWGLSLLAAQAHDVVDGTTVNESINASRYDHFIVSSECDDAGLPVNPMVEESSVEMISGAISEGRVERNNKKALQKVTKHGELVDKTENLEARVLQEVALVKQKMDAAGTAAAAPQIVDEARTASTTPFIRRFVRNPFADSSRWMNAWRFVTNTRREEIDYAGLEDSAFLSKMRSEIQHRRAVLGR